METIYKIFKNTLIVFILLFLLIAGYCSYKAYNNTWTIDDGHVKYIYDDYDDCFMNHLGTKTTDICKDEEKVIFKNDDKNK